MTRIAQQARQPEEFVRPTRESADALADEGTDAAGEFQFAKALHSLTGIAAQYALLDKRRQQLLGKERIPLRATVYERNKVVLRAAR